MVLLSLLFIFHPCSMAWKMFWLCGLISRCQNNKSLDSLYEKVLAWFWCAIWAYFPRSQLEQHLVCQPMEATTNNVERRFVENSHVHESTWFNIQHWNFRYKQLASRDQCIYSPIQSRPKLGVCRPDWCWYVVLCSLLSIYFTRLDSCERTRAMILLEPMSACQK